MTKRDEKGRFVSQGPNKGFDEKSGKEMGEKHGSDNNWNAHRRKVLKKYGFLEDE